MSDSETHSDADSPAAAPPSPDSAPARDISQIKITDWERRELPAVSGKREDRFQAVVRQSVLNQIHRHGLSSADIEVCGVLVGNVYHDPSGAWLYIEKAIEGNHATQRAAQVTFTADTWAHIQAIMDKDYPDKRILGWYHTHPGFGIFLSDMDVFIQENFFPEPWQVALVYDPKAKEEGLFLWKAGKPEPTAFLVEEDAQAEEATAVIKTAREVTAKPGQAGEMVGEVSQFADRLDAIEKRQKMILVLLAIIGLIALAWPLAVTAFLPELLQQKQPHPPINLPSDDPTSRPL
jgi:proteasome lid subunit RPN8/RPN11